MNTISKIGSLIILSMLVAACSASKKKNEDGPPADAARFNTKNLTVDGNLSIYLANHDVLTSCFQQSTLADGSVIVDIGAQNCPSAAMTSQERVDSLWVDASGYLYANKDFNGSRWGKIGSDKITELCTDGLTGNGTERFSSVCDLEYNRINPTLSLLSGLYEY